MHLGTFENLGEEIGSSNQAIFTAEIFVCHIYNSNTSNVLINHKRVESFDGHLEIRILVSLIKNALRLQIKRADLQTFTWKKALEPCPILLKPEESGWIFDDVNIKPMLITVVLEGSGAPTIRQNLTTIIFS